MTFCYFVLPLLILPNVDGEWKTTFYLSPNGIDRRTCGNSSEPCRTLDHIYESHLNTGFNSTLLSLATGTYNLQRSLVFKNVEDFAITGVNQEIGEGVQIKCGKDAGLAFFLSKNITLRGIQLHNCGAWQELPHLLPNATVLRFKTALNFDYCKNIRMQSVDILGSTGRAAHFIEVGGILEVINCSFENNTGNADHSDIEEDVKRDKVVWLVSGGGVFVSLNNKSRHRPSFLNVTPAEHETYVHGNRYYFINCVFVRNQLSGDSFVPTYEFQETFDKHFLQGGALAIFFFGDASNSTVLISNCTFLANKAEFGGGLQAEFSDHVSGNVLIVKNSTFERNFGFSAGGGSRVGNMLAPGTSLPRNELRFSETKFVNNFAKWGGGISIYGTSKHEFNSRNIFMFHSCRWLENRAPFGAAIGLYLFNRNFDHIGPEVPFHAEFKQCVVRRNRVHTEEPKVRIGEGTIYSVGVSIVFRGKSVIANNDLTALALDGATLKLHNDVEFLNNKGFRGGAVAMYGHSKIVFMKNSSALFKHNSCLHKGGAIYIEAPGSPHIILNPLGTFPEGCFFAYEDQWSDFDDWVTKITFHDNQAPDDSSGHSVFATTLKLCRTTGETRVHNSVLQWKFIKYITTPGAFNKADVLHFNQTRSEIATDPVNISYDARDWSVSPSQVFHPKVTLWDEQDNCVPGIVNVSVVAITGDNSDAVRLSSRSSLFLVDGHMSSLKLRGKVGRKFSVALHHVGRQILRRVISIKSGLQHCNPGFHLKSGSCVCQKKLVGVSRCDEDGKTVFLKTGFWAGIVNGTFSTFSCPSSFCSCPKIRGKSKAIDECVFKAGEMCSGNRDTSSILCGKCKPGFSAVIGDTHCFKCGKYMFLLWIPVFLAVISGLVVLTMVLDIDAFTGILNGFIYSYQVMLQVVGEQFSFADPVMLFIVNLFGNFRLHIGTHFCLWSQMDHADKLFYHLCVPVVTVLIVITLSELVVRFPNCCLSRRVKAPFRAMCTIAVICYTSITSECLKILHPAIFGGRTVLYLDGSTEFFRGKHAVYGVIAILFVVFVVILFPLVLIFRPFFTSFLKPVFNLNRFRPVFDVLQSCFRDEYRSFAAFYFVCRLVILVIATYVPQGPVKRSLLEVACIMILFIFACVRPYKRTRVSKRDEMDYDWANRSDVFLLLNLSFMAVFSTATLNDDIRPLNKKALEVTVQIMAYVPLLVLVKYLYTTKKDVCWRQWCDYEGEEEPLPPLSETGFDVNKHLSDPLTMDSLEINGE